MKPGIVIILCLCCISCNSLRNLAEEDRVQVIQRSPATQGKLLSSLLIVGTGDAVSRQVIDGSMETLQHKLWGEQIPTAYFFISSNDFSEVNVTRKMQEAGAEKYRYLLFVTQAAGSQLVGRQPLVMLDLDVKLFEKDEAEPLWSSQVNLSGKVYKDDVYRQASALIFFHFKANSLLASR